MEQENKKLLDIIRASIHNPDFYKGLLLKKISWSFKYFFSVILILAVVSTAFLGWRAVPAVNSFFNDLAPNILKYYPDGLEVVIKNGEATSNVEEPLKIEFPKELNAVGASSSVSEDYPEYILVIDTRSTFSDWQDFERYNTIALLTKDALVFTKEGGGVQVQPLKSFPDTTINKKEIASMLDGIKPLSKFAAPVLVLVIFVGVYSALSFKLVYLLVLALFIWFIATKFRKLKIGYKRAYQVGLHAITLPLLAEAFLRIFLEVQIPFLFTILFLLAAWLNLNFKQDEITVVPITDSVPPQTPPSTA